MAPPFTPLLSLPSNHFHLERCGKVMPLQSRAVANAGAPITRLVAVGALYDPVKGLARRDRISLLQTVSAAVQEWDLDVSPDYTFVPVNLDQGQDFLNPPVRFSGVGILAIWHIPGFTAEVSRFVQTHAHIPTSGAHLSRLHSLPSWRCAAAATRAPLIVVIGSGHNEICAKDLATDGYVPGLAIPFLGISSLGQDIFRMEPLFRADIFEARKALLDARARCEVPTLPSILSGAAGHRPLRDALNRR